MVHKYTLEGDLTQPTSWTKIGSVTHLYIYPVKSCKGILTDSFNSAKHAAEKEDLVDRQFMIVDHKQNMVTARKYPHMVLIEVSVSKSVLTLSYPGMEDIIVEVPDTLDGDKGYEVFGEACSGADMGDTVGQWLSDVILNDAEGGIRLIYHPKAKSTRPDKESNVASPNMSSQDKPYYADTFPYMMLSQPSVQGLNKLLEDENVDLEVEHTRFRPNILIDGDFAEFSEDKWAFIQIGDVVFRNARVCDRCVFTTVDPVMGDKHPKQEPLKTLRKYRSAAEEEEKKLFGSSPFFGVFLASENFGAIKIGDDVKIGKQN